MMNKTGRLMITGVLAAAALLIAGTPASAAIGATGDTLTTNPANGSFRVTVVQSNANPDVFSVRARGNQDATVPNPASIRRVDVVFFDDSPPPAQGALMVNAAASTGRTDVPNNYPATASANNRTLFFTYNGSGTALNVNLGNLFRSTATLQAGLGNLADRVRVILRENADGTGRSFRFEASLTNLVPEPASMLLVLAGLAPLALARRRRRSTALTSEDSLNCMAV